MFVETCLTSEVKYRLNIEVTNQSKKASLKSKQRSFHGNLDGITKTNSLCQASIVDFALLESNHLCGFEPQSRRYLFLKSDINLAFFYTFYYIRKSCNKTQRSGTPQNSKICARNEGNHDRDLFMYIYMYILSR